MATLVFLGLIVVLDALVHIFVIRKNIMSWILEITVLDSILYQSRCMTNDTQAGEQERRPDMEKGQFMELMDPNEIILRWI